LSALKIWDQRKRKDQMDDILIGLNPRMKRDSCLKRSENGDTKPESNTDQGHVARTQQHTILTAI